MDSSPQEYIQELLRPLESYHSTGEYSHQHQSMVDFDNCLKTLEERYADLYEQVQTLENKLSIYK